MNEFKRLISFFKIETIFTEKWFSEIKWSETDSNEGNLALLKARIIGHRSQFEAQFNRVLLSMDFLLLDQNILKDIESCGNLYSILRNDYELDDSKIVAERDKHPVDSDKYNEKRDHLNFLHERKFETERIVENEFIFPVDDNLNLLKNFIQSVQKKQRRTGRNRILYNNYNANSTIDTSSKSAIFNLNIEIAICDLELDSTDKTLSKLEKIHDSLIKTEGRNVPKYIYNLTKAKCQFLTKKILIRHLEKSEDEKIIDQDKDVILDRINSCQIGSFEHFSKDLQKHYDWDRNATFTSSDISILLDKWKSTPLQLSFKDRHKLIKIAKDIEKDEAIVNEMKIDFIPAMEKYRKTDPNKFDAHASSVMQNYFLNNAFSSFIENLDVSPSQIEQKIKEITRTQRLTGVSNFHPFYKACEYFKSKIEHQISKEPDDTDDPSNFEAWLNNTKEMLDIFRQSIESLQKSLNWCSRENYFAAQMDYENCTFIYKEHKSDLTVFCASSFILPIYYPAVFRTTQKLENTFDKLESKIAMINYLSKEKIKILNTAREVRNESKNNEKRSIEILGIFSAVVLFAVGNIQIFSMKGMTIDLALKFMLTFGYCLSLFVLLIFFITRDQDDLGKLNTRTHKTIKWALLIATIVSILYMLFGSNNSNSKNTRDIDQVNYHLYEHLEAEKQQEEILVDQIKEDSTQKDSIQ